MKELTKAELQVMQVLWKLEKGFLKDIVDDFSEPKPAVTTISTIIRILTDKGFVGYEIFGKTHRYFPIVSKEDYARNSMKRMVKNFFGDSPGQFASFFTEDAELTIQELEELKRIIEKQIAQQRSKPHE